MRHLYKSDTCIIYLVSLLPVSPIFYHQSFQTCFLKADNTKFMQVAGFRTAHFRATHIIFVRLKIKRNNSPHSNTTMIITITQAFSHQMCQTKIQLKVEKDPWNYYIDIMVGCWSDISAKFLDKENLDWRSAWHKTYVGRISMKGKDVEFYNRNPISSQRHK